MIVRYVTSIFVGVPIQLVLLKSHPKVPLIAGFVIHSMLPGGLAGALGHLLRIQFANGNDGVGGLGERKRLAFFEGCIE